MSDKDDISERRDQLARDLAEHRPATFAEAQAQLNRSVGDLGREVASVLHLFAFVRFLDKIGKRLP